MLPTGRLRYRQLFGNRLNPATLSNEPSGNLVALFDAASLAANDNPVSSTVDDMLQADPELQRRLQQVHLVLVTAPNAPIDTHLISEWNGVNPSMAIHAPYSAAQWEGIDVTGISSFYLLRNGKVVDRRTGWSDTGKADLLKLIDAAE